MRACRPGWRSCVTRLKTSRTPIPRLRPFASGSSRWISLLTRLPSRPRPRPRSSANAVPQRGSGSFDVLERRREATLEQGADLGRQEHGLRAARRRARAHERRTFSVLSPRRRVRRLEQANRVILDVPRHGHRADSICARGSPRALPPWLDLGLELRGGAIDDRVQLFPIGNARAA